MISFSILFFDIFQDPVLNGIGLRNNLNPCKAHPNLRNVVVKVSKRSVQGTTIYVAKYSCDPGYILEAGKNEKNKRFCNPTKNDIKEVDGIKISSNKWSGKKPLCSMYFSPFIPHI